MIVDIIYANCVPFQNAPQTCCLWGLLITCNNWCVSLHSDPIKVISLKGYLFIVVEQTQFSV